MEVYNMENIPIGSVVKLKGEEYPLMIIGKLPLLNKKDDNKLTYFDYKALPYPIGDVGEDQFYCFNSEDIAEIVYMGYQDGSDMVFNNLLFEIKQLSTMEKAHERKQIDKDKLAKTSEKLQEGQHISSANRLSN